MGTVAVFGVGQVGAAITRALVRYPDVTALHLFDIDAGRLEIDAGEAAAIAALLGHSVDVHATELDMRSVEQLSCALARAEPDVIVHSASFLNPWSLVGIAEQLWEGDLPAGVPDPYGPARGGAWLPIPLTLIWKLMLARREVCPTVPVVNVSLPDVVNAVLDKVGLAPICGGGNSDMLVPGIQALAAQRLGMPTAEVHVQMVTSYHLLSVFIFDFDRSEIDRYPYWLRIFGGGRDVSSELDLRELVLEAGRIMPRRLAGYPRIAASVARNAMYLLRGDARVVHVPGPAGLVGGYDARLRRTGAEVVLPDGLAQEEAIAVNEDALEGLGIERILDDGSVRLTERSYEIMKRTLGYDCRELHLLDTEDRAVELVERVRALTPA